MTWQGGSEASAHWITSFTVITNGSINPKSKEERYSSVVSLVSSELKSALVCWVGVSAENSLIEGAAKSWDEANSWIESYQFFHSVYGLLFFLIPSCLQKTCFADQFLWKGLPSTDLASLSFWDLVLCHRRSREQLCLRLLVSSVAKVVGVS